MVDFQEFGGRGGGWLWNFHGPGVFFKNFLNKPMQRESNFGGC